MADSLAQTVTRPADFEMLVAVDLDDKPSIDTACALQTPFRCSVVAAANPFSLRKKYIPLEAKATGTMLWYGADDFVFRTQGWDVTTRDRYEDLPAHRVAMFALADGFDWHNVKAYRTPCGLPGLTQEWVRAAGYTLPPYFDFNCLETYLWGIALRLEQAGHPECRQHCLDIMADHIHHSNGRRAHDATDDLSADDLQKSCRIYESIEGTKWEEDFRRVLSTVEGRA